MKLHDSLFLDHLVIGLPINYITTSGLIDHVHDMLKGFHTIPDIHSPGNSKVINVSKVTVIPQIVGSLFFLSAEHNLHSRIQTREDTVVTFDIGYGTFLWLTTRGFKPQTSRTSGVSGGASVILKEAITLVTGSDQTTINLLEKVDKAIRLGHETVNIDDRQYQIQVFRKAIKSILSEVISQAFNGIGNIRDVDHFFLTGGGSHLYKDAIVERLGNRKLIETSGNPQFNNVKGFQLYSEQNA
jgi:plasmid segregation protein ParM